MFLNGLYTDGYICRVLLARNTPEQIPIAKTTILANYVTHLTYMTVDLYALFNFYNFRTARINW